MNIEWKGNQEKIHDLKKFKNGKIIVNACPGSGKTLCVSKRIIKFINQHESKVSGLAITSFTNVAVNEIKDNYERETGEKIEHPHFIGTLDHFINKYIFLPYGYLVMNCGKRPKLVGEPHSKWHHEWHRCRYFDQISFNKENQIYPINERIQFDYKMKKCKKDLIKEGYATQEDANYFTMRILYEYPQITKALINKFPYLIIDEAQDLSEIQMEIVNILIENGLKNVLLVGDPYQAIFEWKTAKPQLFIEKYKEWKEKYNTAINLEYTFRCSKNISKYLTKFSGIPIKSCANDSINLKPTLIPHEENYNQIVDRFIKRVKKLLGNDIEKNKVAVLFRSRTELNKFINSTQDNYKFENIFKTSEKDISEFEKTLGCHIKIKNESNIKNYTENILKGEYYFLNNDFINGFREFEKAFIKIKTNQFNNTPSLIKDSIAELGLYKHRKCVWQFIKLFKPPTSKDQLIDEWIDINNKSLLKKGKFYLNKIKTMDKTKRKISKILTWKMINLDIGEKTLEYYCGTIHSVKGKNFDAVLLLLKSQCTNKLGNDLMKEKELRNVYVGMSRARHILCIAVPQDNFIKWNDFFNQSSLDKFFK